MTSRRVANRYAKAIIEMAQEGDSVEEVHEDFLTLGQAIEASRDLRNFLLSPIIDDHVKSRVLTELFTDKVSELMMRFVQLLARKGRSRDLPAIITAFERLRDVERNETSATIRSAVDLRDDQKQSLVRHLSAVSGRTIRPTWIVDPQLVGGLTARFEDTMIDASVQNHLQRLRRAFIEGVQI